MKSIYDRDFRYVPSHETNVKATFARAKRKLREEEERRERDAEEAKVKVSQIKKAKAS